MVELGTNREEIKVKNMMENISKLVKKCHGLKKMKLMSKIVNLTIKISAFDVLVGLF